MTRINALADRGDLFARASPRLPRLLLALVAVPVGKLRVLCRDDPPVTRP